MKKQSSGLYRTKVTIGHDQTGKPVHKWISARTKKELEEKRNAIIKRYITGSGVNDDVLFAPYARNWLSTYKQGRARSTRLAYHNAIENHLIPVFGDYNMRSISPSQIQAFMNRFEGWSMSSVNNIIGVIGMIFKAAMRDRIVEYDPTAYIERPRTTRRKEKEALTAEQRRSIEKAIETSPDGLFVAMIYYTGMRIGESCGVQWCDIDFHKRLLHVQRNIDHSGSQITVGPLKTPSSNRFIPIPEALYNMLRSIPIGMPNAFLFTGRNGNPLSYSGAVAKFKRVMLAAGMAEQTGTCDSDIKAFISPHCLRHNYLTMCYEHGIDAFTASKLAGHTTTTMTQTVYTHLSKEHLQNIQPEIEDMFSNKVAQKLHNQK